MQTVRIQTTQNVVIEYQPASVGDRIIATLFDSLIMFGYMITFILLLSRLDWNLSTAGFVVLYLPIFLYQPLCEILMDGQTFGKRQVRIKVIRLDGSQPSIGSYLLRWLVGLVEISFTAGVLAVITVAANGRGQRLGDMAAGTSVISLRRRVGLSETQLPTVEEGYEPVYPQAASLSDHDIAIIKEALQVYMKNPSGNLALIETLTLKVKELLQITEPVSPLTFLRTVLRDHTHLTTHA